MRVSRLTDVLRSPTRRRLVPIALAAAVALTAAACTGARPHLASGVEATTTIPGGQGTTRASETAEVAEAQAAAIDVYSSATDESPTSQLTAADATSAPDVPLIFLVKHSRGERLEVYLPTAPAGSTGWVRAADVRVSRVSFRVELELSSHRLRVFDEGRSVLDEEVAIGVTDRPMAGTTYYLKELLQSPDQSGPYGRLAYVLSGANTSVESFTSGDGIVGIHGTDDRSSLGSDTAKGSIGVAERVLDRLADQIGLPLGTPVTVLP